MTQNEESNMAEDGMSISWIILIPIALLVIGGAFALIYWLLGKGGDDGNQSGTS
jgi:hypothetical protein